MSSPNTPGMSSISVTTTTAALLALTTPFQQPTGCDSHFTTTSLVTTYFDDTTYTVPLVVSERVDSCYPSDWDSVAPESRLHFSPAVCPSGWTYYEMEESGEMASTAYCCNSGYSLTYDAVLYSILSNACGRWMSNKTMRLDSDRRSITAEDTYVVHEAWAITWASDDRATLTPSLPTLTSGKRVPMWTPGQHIPDGKYDRKEDNGSLGTFYEPESVVVFIVLPVLAGVGIFSCIGCCVASRVKRKRRERVALERAVNENVAVTTLVELHNISPNGNRK